MGGYGNPMCFITEYIPILPGEIFKPITNETIPGIKPYYMISNKGRVWQGCLNRFKVTSINNSGYVVIGLATDYGVKSITVSRLVMMVFCPIPNLELYEVNHKNGNKFINELWNLEWCTEMENKLHARVTGLIKSGEDRYNAILSNDTVKLICEDLQSNILSQYKIAEKYGISRDTVNNIKCRHSYRHVSEPYNFPDCSKPKLFSDDDVHGMCQYFQENPKDVYTNISDHCRHAMDSIGYDYHNDDRRIVKSARNIYNKEQYTHISNNYNF